MTGADVRELRFQQVLRGYKTAEVDWALDRLAHEIDDLRARLAAYEDTAYENTGGDAPGGDEADSGRTGASVAAEAAGDRSDEGE